MAKEHLGKLFILYGPSGSGKSTLISEIWKKFPEIVSPIITYTTRQPRVNEIHGKDYYFINQEDFFLKQSQDYFIHVTNYLNNQYGASKAIIKDLEAGKNLIAIFDRAGAIEVKNTIPNSVLIWITTSLKELEYRLSSRYIGNLDQLAIRIAQAQKDIEIEAVDAVYDYVVINSNLEKALKDLEETINTELILK